MRRSIAILHIILVIIMCGCGRTEELLRNGDLIFEIAGNGAAAQAIDAATAHAEEESFSHVGIIEVYDGEAFVIEAASESGVRRIPLAEFLATATQYDDGTPAVAVMRMVGEYDTAQFVERAKSHIGEPYDNHFLPDNGKMYCSELVYESFVTAEGEHIFTARPMNFRAADGTMPQYWTELFESLGEPVPQGESGTNPNDMAQENLLRRVAIRLDNAVRHSK